MDIIKDILKSKKNWLEITSKIKKLDRLEGKIGMKLINLLIQHEQTELLHDILEKHHVSLDFSDRYGRTPIHQAVELRSIPILETLLKYGNTKKIINKRDKYWHFAPLHYAVLNKDAESVKLLLEHHAQADIKADFSDHKRIDIDSSVENARYPSRIRPIHLAAIVGNVDILKILLKTGKPIGINSHAERDGLTALFMAAIEYSNPATKPAQKTKLMETIKFLLGNGANPKSVNYDGESLLYYQNIWETPELFELFVDKIDVNLINYNKDTVLHNRLLQPKFSSNKKEIEKHQRILARMDPFYINYPNVFYYETLVHLYARYEMWKDLKVELSQKYLDIYRENKDGYSALDFISNRDRADFLEMTARGYTWCLQNCKDVKPVVEWEKKCRHIKSTFADTSKLQRILGNKDISDRDTLCILVAKKMIAKNENSVPQLNDNVKLQSSKYKINWWTSTAFEIFFGILYIMKKYNRETLGVGKHVCFLQNFDFIKDPERRYMSINDLFEDNLTKFCFAWHNDTLKYDSKFVGALQKCEARFFAIPLALNYGRTLEGHFNSLLIDYQRKTVERFEPHGYKASWYHNYKLLDQKLESTFRKILPGFKYISPVDYITRIGFQGYDTVTAKFDTTQFIDIGYCIVWSFWYIDLRLGNPDLELNRLVELAMLRIHEKFTSTKKFIMAYSNSILKPRDRILVSDKTTIQDTQCLINRIKELIL
jgi:ankyrin repeat protein